MNRRILFQVHWFLGISIGLVLSVMGVTGALMSYQEEITQLLNTKNATVDEPGSRIPLLPDALLEKVMAQRSNDQVRQFVLFSDPNRAVEVFLQSRESHGSFYVDPYDGRILGQATGTRFFQFVEQLHRFLAIPAEPGKRASSVGRQITGIAAFSLIFFAFSGLYLRWPRRPLDWGAWLILDFRRTGRNFYRTLHSVIGAWLLLFYLISALTGLYWSYQWYRRAADNLLHIHESHGQKEHGSRSQRSSDANGMNAEHAGMRDGERGHAFRLRRDTGEPGHRHDFNEEDKLRPLGTGIQMESEGVNKNLPFVNSAWKNFIDNVGGHYGRAVISYPREDGPIEIALVRQGQLRDGLSDCYLFDIHDGHLLQIDLLTDRAFNKKLSNGLLALHSGAMFGFAGRIVMALSSAMMPLFAVTGWMLYLGRRRRLRGLLPIDSQAAGDFLIAYASQTGSAQRIAQYSASMFLSVGRPVRLLPISLLDDDVLTQTQILLLVVSTYGDGGPPDSARSFAKRMAQGKLLASGISYAVMALGDREYPDFCRFGRDVDNCLHAGGGQRLFDIVLSDSDDKKAQKQWHKQLVLLGAADVADAKNSHSFDSWTLVSRQLLNPGSQGGGVYHLQLKPHRIECLAWMAGDIAEVVIPNEVERISDDVGDLPLIREYSIASVPSDGTLDLLVRQVVKANGNLGLGSGWLTTDVVLHSPILIRIRANPGFRQRRKDIRLILIGSGTGLAGLRAHLRQRNKERTGGNWLIFGERNRLHDAFFKHELDGWLADGTLARLDFAYSRDSDCGRYVQHVLRQCAGDVRSWIDAGAAVLVCGSLKGMAPAVDLALRDAIGDVGVDRLIEEGRYLRDIY